jgi:hypothetical protein
VCSDCCPIIVYCERYLLVRLQLDVAWDCYMAYLEKQILDLLL